MLNGPVSSLLRDFECDLQRVNALAQIPDTKVSVLVVWNVSHGAMEEVIQTVSKKKIQFGLNYYKKKYK